jgi:hypothetical protein
MSMSERSESVGDLSDEELVSRFREIKSEVGGADPELTPPERGADSEIRDEMERRGLSPDREDVIPDDESDSEDPIVDDHA